MFHKKFKPLCYPITRWSAINRTRKIALSVLGVRYLSALNIQDVRSNLATTSPANLGNTWRNLFKKDANAALELRYEFYDVLRRAGLSQNELRWCISIPGSLPKEDIRFADLLFVLEYFAKRRSWNDVVKLMVDVSSEFPAFWEQLALKFFDENCPAPPPEVCLRILCRSSVKLGIDLGHFNHEKDLPILRMLQALFTRYEPSALITALDRLARDNSIAANIAATAFLRAITYTIVSVKRPQTPTLSSEFLSDIDYMEELPTMLWEWKRMRKVAHPEDLELYMTYLTYRRRSEIALKTYDENPRLHDTEKLNLPLLLAAAGAADFVRLQSVFEAVERNTQLITNLGSRRYSTVLGALGYLGNARIIDSIFQNLARRKPELLTRGVFHAVIHSHGVRGDLAKAIKYYDLMEEKEIAPTRTTFMLVLQAFRDASDLQGALKFVSSEMLVKHQHALTNGDLSVLLSLCGKRRDAQSAKHIWTWATSLVKPDRLSWNSYLNALVTSNEFTEAQSVFADIEKLGFTGLDTLTIMLNAAGRSRAVVEYTTKFVERKKQLDLPGDSAWYTSLLSAIAESGNLAMFEQVLNEMKLLGLKPAPVHYALYTEQLAKAKQFAKHEEVTKEMVELNIPTTYAYIEKQFRLLVASGASPESRESAHLAAINLIQQGFFDTSSNLVPRDAIPVRVIEPVLRRMIKSGQTVSAGQLLDGLRKQRGSRSSLQDEAIIWMLHLEICQASKAYEKVDKLWSKFLDSLPALFVLSEEKGLSKPRFIIPKRYKHVFAPAIDVRIDAYAHQKSFDALIALPPMLETLGLEMNGRNYNSYIIALAKLGHGKLAFDTAVFARSKTTFTLSSEATKALVSVFDQVNYRHYGQVGENIRRARNRARHVVYIDRRDKN